MVRPRSLSAFRSWLVEDNVGLVLYVASDISGRNTACDLEALMSAGNEALVRAAQAFDIYRRIRFSTYAHQAIQRACWRELKRVGWLRKRYRGDVDDQFQDEREWRDGEATHADLHKAIRQLRPDLRRVVELRMALGTPVALQKFGASPTTFYKKHRLACSTLRRMMGY